MFHAHPLVPSMKALEQNWLQFERVVASGVGHTHQLSENKEHEQVVFVPPSARDGTPVGCMIELAEERL